MRSPSDRFVRAGVVVAQAAAAVAFDGAVLDAAQHLAGDGGQDLSARLGRAHVELEQGMLAADQQRLTWRLPASVRRSATERRSLPVLRSTSVPRPGGRSGGPCRAATGRRFLDRRSTDRPLSCPITISAAQALSLPSARSCIALLKSSASARAKAPMTLRSRSSLGSHGLASTTPSRNRPRRGRRRGRILFRVVAGGDDTQQIGRARQRAGQRLDLLPDPARRRSARRSREDVWVERIDIQEQPERQARVVEMRAAAAPTFAGPRADGRGVGVAEAGSKSSGISEPWPLACSASR